MPRDEQDYETRRQQIIDGALQAFSTKGFEKATNRDIARAARIRSPGLIYHYFRDKWDLFSQMVEERAPSLQLIARGDELMDLPPRQALEKFAGVFLTTLDNRAAMAVFRVMLGESMHSPAVAEVFNRLGPARGLSVLRRYLAKQMDAGHLKRVDPGAAARCFAGAMIAYMLTREVFHQADSNTLGGELMLRTAIDIFLHGLEVEEPAQEAQELPRASISPLEK